MKEISKDTLIGSTALCDIYLRANKEKYDRLISSIAMLEEDGDVYLRFGSDQKLPIVLVEVQNIFPEEAIYTVLENYNTEDGNWDGPSFDTLDLLAGWWLMTYCAD